MGSYLSIVNDTSDPWRCKVGPDEEALRISGMIITVVGAVATVIGTAGGALPLIAGLTTNGVVAVFGVPTSALATLATGAATIGAYTSVIGGVSGFGMSVAEVLAKMLDKDGYELIAPGQSHRWGKMSLSLWQQGTCVKSVLVNEKTGGTEKQDIEAYGDGQRFQTKENGDDDLVGVFNQTEPRTSAYKLFYFHPNDTKEASQNGLPVQKPELLDCQVKEHDEHYYVEHGSTGADS